MWRSVDLGARELSVLTAPIEATQTTIQANYPRLKRYAYAREEKGAQALLLLGVSAFADEGGLPGVALVTAILKDQGISDREIDGWIQGRVHALQNPAARDNVLAWGGLG